MKASKFMCNALTSCIVWATAAAAQASTPAFNPDDLGAAQLARVSGACETVLSLNSQEPLQGGYRSGSDHLDFWTNHYRGCIVSLSDSLVDTASTGAAGSTVFEAGKALRPKIVSNNELACRSLGIDSSGELQSCVTALSWTLYSVDHPID